MEKNQDLLVQIALELGFKTDNYYSAKEKMLRSCVTTVGGKG